MEQGRIIQELLEFHRKGFENTMRTMTVLLEQTEKMLELFIREAPNLSKEQRKAIEDWILACREGRMAYARTMEEGYKKVVCPHPM